MKVISLNDDEEDFYVYFKNKAIVDRYYTNSVEIRHCPKCGGELQLFCWTEGQYTEVCEDCSEHLPLSEEQ